jgi:hypothetical protein
MSLKDVTDLFRKNSDGTWTCIMPAIIYGPIVRVRIEPGITFVQGRQFVGVDVAGILDSPSTMDDDIVKTIEKAGVHMRLSKT